jgi:hypothetical protein
MPKRSGILVHSGAVRWILVCIALVSGEATVASAQTGTFVVTGRVTERGQDLPVPNAAVLLGEEHRAVTDSAGRFEIRGVRPGRYAFTVDAFGYRTAQTSIIVFDDVEGAIQLDPEPVALDTIKVRPRRYDLRGRVVDAESGRSVPYVTIRAAGASTAATDAGTFRIRDLAAGQHTVIIEGFGWMPLRTVIDLEADTMMTFAVEPDPITERMIAAQIERITTRSASVGVSRRTIGRAEILDSQTASPIDIIGSRGAVRFRDCIDPSDQERQLNVPMSSVRMCIATRGGITRPLVYIDDRQVCGLEFLHLYTNALLHHIEVFSGGRAIRAYTSQFIERLAADRVPLQPMAGIDAPRLC